jgi:hypothetical protein
VQWLSTVYISTWWRHRQTWQRFGVTENRAGAILRVCVCVCEGSCSQSYLATPSLCPNRRVFAGYNVCSSLLTSHKYIKIRIKCRALRQVRTVSNASRLSNHFLRTESLLYLAPYFLSLFIDCSVHFLNIVASNICSFVHQCNTFTSYILLRHVSASHGHLQE